jgi:hypothetical protein
VTFPPGGGQGFPSSALVNPIVIGAELFYNPGPGAGNLTESISNSAGTDAYGNAYLAGFTAYTQLSPGFWVANNLSTQNQLAWFTAPSSAGPWTLLASIQADTNSDLTIVSGNRIGVGNPLVALIGSAFETWHTLGGLGATGYTINFGRFRYEAIGPGYEVLDIELQAGAAAVAGVFTWTIIPGAQYQFAGPTSRSYPLGYNGTIAAGQNFGSILVDGQSSGNPGRVRVDIPALPNGTVIGATVWVPLS